MSGRGVWETVQLVAALTFVFLMAYTPHVLGHGVDQLDPPNVREIISPYYHTFVKQDRDPYPYPLHVDEHIHWVYVSNLQRNHETQMHDAYSPPVEGQSAFASLRGAVHERGFHVVIASIQWITGIPMDVLFHYLPAVWLAFGALGLYAALRPHPAAPIVAAFVAFVPTTVRFMGPAFLVPIGFVLAWLPAVLILAGPSLRRVSSSILLIVAVVWSFFIHLIGGFAAVALLMLAAACGPSQERKPRLAILALAFTPLLWIARAFTADVQNELNREEDLPIDLSIFDALGPVLIIAWLVGILLLFARPPMRSRASFFAASLMSLATLGLILAGLTFEWDSYATYARWHPPFFFLAAVPLGFLFDRIRHATFAAFTKMGTRFRGKPRVLEQVYAYAIVVVVFGLAGFQGIQDHVQTPYYRVIQDSDWEAFQVVVDTAGPEYEVFLTHPWKAPVLTAISGKSPRSVLYPGAPPVRGEEYANYLQTGASLDYFILNDVTLVVAAGRPPFPQFVELGPDVWGLHPDIARQIAEIRAAERAS